MDATIPDRGWDPRRGPPVHPNARIDTRATLGVRKSLSLCTKGTRYSDIADWWEVCIFG